MFGSLNKTTTFVGYFIINHIKIIVMKKLVSLLVLMLTVSSVTFSQITYTMLNQVENAILERYDIDYTGAHVRYMVESGKVNKLDADNKNAFNLAYKQFTKWNQGYFKSIPDTTYFSNGYDYMSDKNSDEFLVMTFNDTRKIVGKFSVNVNDFKNNIQTIEILELYNTGIPNLIDHVIMIKDFSNTWSLLTIYSYNLDVECEQCYIP